MDLHMDAPYLRNAADRPITGAADDQLARAHLAHHVADQVVGYHDSACLVVGIYGPWGSGKSSVLNLVDERIRTLTHGTQSQPIIVRFNPWNFASVDQLVSMFLREIRLAIQQGAGQAIGEKIGPLLTMLGEVLSAGAAIPTLEPAGIMGKLLVRSGQVLNKESRTLEKIRADLDDAMRSLGKRLVIMIDDLDRLESINILLILRMVRLNADLPNTIYLMAFDRDVVVKTLQNVQAGINGQDYLDKIVQVGIDIPRSSETSR